MSDIIDRSFSQTEIMSDPIFYSQNDSSLYASMVSFASCGMTENGFSLNDLLDINELFQDDFFPPEINYSPMFRAFDDDAEIGIMEDINPVTEGRKFEETAQVKNDVILIPPKMPTNMASSTLIPTTTHNHDNEVDSENEDYNDSKLSKAPHFKRDIKGEPKTASGKISIEFGGEWKVERRERNREHAKRSRIRKRLLLDSLQDQLLGLRSENLNLRRVIENKLPQLSSKILSECTTIESSLLFCSDDEDAFNDVAEYNTHGKRTTKASKSLPPTKILMEPDYRLIQSLVHSQQNFVISDPLLPDNPIVYASDGFCKMTGYKLEGILGRNCRFLQGPGTDQAAVDIIRQGVIEGRDISVCLLNYKADGSPFWNQFFLAALKDDEGKIVNHIGVQCEVNNISVSQIKDRVKKIPVPMSE